MNLRPRRLSLFAHIFSREGMMATNWRDYLSTLPEDQQKEIADLGAKLIRREASLRKLREARERSQAEIAQKLGVNQAAVSKMERRADMYISTLRKLIEAMGGELDIIARFPDQSKVRITQFNKMASK